MSQPATRNPPAMRTCIVLSVLVTLLTGLVLTTSDEVGWIAVVLVGMSAFMWGVLAGVSRMTP